MKKKQSISVIIPVRNEEKKIGKCIESVLNQTLKPLEIIVVDGHSTDNTVKIAKTFPVTILYEDYGTRAGACQIGLNHSKGKYVAFTDADCIPQKNWLETELEILKSYNDVAGVGCCIDNISQGIWEETINEVSKMFLGSGRSIQGRQFKTEKQVTSISGCHSLYKKHILQEIKGFDVNLKTCEDTEINRRIRKKDYKLIYTPNTKILHNHTRGTKLFSKRMFQYGKGRAQSKLFDIQLLVPLFLPLLFLIAILYFPIFSLIVILSFLVLLSSAIFIAIKKNKYQFVITVPTILVIQYISYSIGFWKGVILKD